MSDKYYTPTEWAQLTSEQQERVRELRAGRDRQRGVHAVDSSRSVRQRADNSSSLAPSAASTSGTSAASTIGVGSAMSGRASQML